MLKFITVATAILLAGSSAMADEVCFADYKAKKNDPLKLHYGVIELAGNQCDDERAARAEIARRINVDNWTLLTVVSIFDEREKAGKKRKAGDYYLRY